MTALPAQPHRLLSVGDYVALGDDPDDVRFELQEGNLVMSPKPTPEHQIAVQELVVQLRNQVPDAFRAVFDIDVDLRLVPPSGPGTVRAPDIAVVSRSGLDRRRQQSGVIHADEVLLAVEVISPGSRRVDKVFKHSEYADAGIPHYWVVDLGEAGERTTLTAHHLAGEFGYADAGPVGGTFTAAEPFAVRIDLDTLG